MISTTLRNRIAAPVLAAAIAIAAPFLADEAEGRRYVAYQDSVGKWTICMGRTRGVYDGMTATHAQCEAWLREDVASHARYVDQCIHADLQPQTVASLISLTYNVGPQAVCGSTLQRMANSGDLVGACRQIVRWRNAGGRDCRVRANNCYGIILRREAETEMCFAGVWATVRGGVL